MELSVVGVHWVSDVPEETASVDDVTTGAVVFGLGLDSCAGGAACEVAAGEEIAFVDGVTMGVGTAFGLGLFSCAVWTDCEVAAEPVVD